MIELKTEKQMSQQKKYDYLLEISKDILDTEDNLYANLANLSATINFYMDDINWVGFYLVDDQKENELVLNAFQGNVACTRIPFSKGVCGKCISTLETILVENVHEFEGHIACDSATNSELVIPIIINDAPFGLLDIDSPEFSRFSEIDKVNLEKLVKLIEQKYNA